MSRIAFTDESGIDGSSKCYAIGAVAMPEARVERFNADFRQKLDAHGVVGEARWSKVAKSHGLINFCLEWVHELVSSDAMRFDAIVVNTQQYRKWSEHGADRVEAFYRTYTYLLRHLATQLRQPTQVLIDDRSEKYDKHHEVLETIGNRMLAKLHTTGRLSGVSKVSSREHPGVQLADLVTGAVCTAHRLLLEPRMQVNAGKRLLIARIARVLGLDALHYDTWPNSKFNIWHFPLEYRRTPATVSISCSRTVPFVTADEVRGA